MSRLDKIGTTSTTVYQSEDKMTVVRYHKTPVVAFDAYEILLNTGGWRTATTKTRMNQASNVFGLGFTVFQKNYYWYVGFKDETIPFNEDFIRLER